MNRRYYLVYWLTIYIPDRTESRGKGVDHALIVKNIVQKLTITLVSNFLLKKVYVVLAISG